VSVDAVSWALNLAQDPADRGGQPSSACKFVLVGLANHAGPDGTGVFRRWPRWPAIPGWRSGRYAHAWIGCKPQASSHPATRGIAAARIKRADLLEAVGAFVVALAARRSWFC
jgi:hypothetical protein